MQNQMKKAVATVCMGAAVLTLTPAVSMAETAVEPFNYQSQNTASPYMLYIQKATSVLTVSGTTATVDCSTMGSLGKASKAKIVAELQYKNGSSWTTVKTWTDTQNSYRASVYEDYSVTKGKTYRVKATATVWEGSQSETQYVYSSEKTV
ncbi:MAG: hypothetical protein IKU46_04005 [Peptococcaceae bacterium]|nr:hypothetical protein [Peptococcaceae bacterium]